MMNPLQEAQKHICIAKSFLLQSKQLEAQNLCCQLQGITNALTDVIRAPVYMDAVAVAIPGLSQSDIDREIAEHDRSVDAWA